MVSGCLEERWQEDSLKLMELFSGGKMRLVLSSLTIDEILAAPGTANWAACPKKCRS